MAFPPFYSNFRCMSPNDLETLVTYNTAFEAVASLRLVSPRAQLMVSPYFLPKNDGIFRHRPQK